MDQGWARVVIGMFANPNHAAICLTNLEEADFKPRDISVVMRTRQDIDAIADVSGSLTGVTPDELVARLGALGVPSRTTAAYRDAILRGGVFVAVSAGEAEDVAREILEDHNATEVRVLGRE